MGSFLVDVGIRCPHTTKLGYDFFEVQNYLGCSFLRSTKIPALSVWLAYLVPETKFYTLQHERAGKIRRNERQRVRREKPFTGNKSVD